MRRRRTNAGNSRKTATHGVRLSPQEMPTKGAFTRWIDWLFISNEGNLNRAEYKFSTLNITTFTKPKLQRSLSSLRSSVCCKH